MEKNRVILQGKDSEQAVEIEVDFALEYVLYIKQGNPVPKIIIVENYHELYKL